MIAAALSSLVPTRSATDMSPWSDFWYGPVGQTSTSGIVVRPDNAMGVSAVYGCIRILRESVASLPFKVFRRSDEGIREEARDLWQWDLLHDAPNAWQTPMEWLEMGIAHILLRGNFYCLIQGRLSAAELIPLNPDRMEVRQDEQTHRLSYTYRRSTGESVRISAENLLHVRGMTLNGVTGVSVIEYARNTVGLALAQETHGASLFRNGGLPTFWIKRPAGRKWTAEARANFRAGWRKLHGGAENAGNPPILEDDMELREIGLSNRDSQWIESRGLGAEEVCRFFGVPSFMIVKEAAPVGTAEQQSLWFARYTLRPLCLRFEQAIDRDLLDRTAGQYSKLVIDAHAAADLKTRAEAHNIAVQGGWRLVNEVRAIEDLNPLEGGDVPRFPLNMQPVGGGPDENEQGGQPGRGKPKPPKQKEREEEEATAYEQRRQKKRESEAIFAPLLSEAAGRIAAAELKALSPRAEKAADDRAKWNKWAAGVLKTQELYAVKTLEPICAAWLTATAKVIDPLVLGQSFYASDEVGALYDANIHVPTLLDEWAKVLPDSIYAQLERVFFDETI